MSMKSEGFRSSRVLRAALVTVTVGTVAVVGLARMQAQANQLNRGVPTDNDLHVLPVQGNVSMIVGDGANIAMSVGNDGVLLVDSGLPENVDKLVALVRQVAPNKPIRLIINTNADKDHAFGNEKLGPMGRRI